MNFSDIGVSGKSAKIQISQYRFFIHVRDRAWFSEGIIDRTGVQTMLYLSCTRITNVDLAQYGVALAEDWISVECGTITAYAQLNRVSDKKENLVSICGIPLE